MQTKRTDTDIQTYRQTDIQTYRHTDRQTDRHTDIQTYRHTDIQTYRQTDRQTDIHTYIHTDIHTYIHAHTHMYIYIFTYAHTHTYIYIDISMDFTSLKLETTTILSCESWFFTRTFDVIMAISWTECPRLNSQKNMITIRHPAAVCCSNTELFAHDFWTIFPTKRCFFLRRKIVFSVACQENPVMFFEPLKFVLVPGTVLTQSIPGLEDFHRGFATKSVVKSW